MKAVHRLDSRCTEQRTLKMKLQEEKRTTSEKVHGCSKDGVRWRQMIQLKEELCVCSSFQSFSNLCEIFVKIVTELLELR